MESKEQKYIKIKSDGKYLKAKTGNLKLESAEEVLFEKDQFQDVGIISFEIPDKEKEETTEEATVIRKLTDKDKEKLEERKNEAKSFLEKCAEKIKKHGLTMDLLDADLSYDGKKLTFYFSSSGRVDFRSLVPDLASTFKKLIRLQQVASRNKAKCMETVGRCGREICCRKVLRNNLDNVTLEMAYEQNLGQMGTNRVTGVCGKLMCCLKYELDEYHKAKKKMPSIGSRIKTPEGEGTVLSQNVIKNKISVELDNDKRILEVDC